MIGTLGEDLISAINSLGETIFGTRMDHDSSLWFDVGVMLVAGMALPWGDFGKTASLLLL